jgi:hypothetical protein
MTLHPALAVISLATVTLAAWGQEQGVPLNDWSVGAYASVDHAGASDFRDHAGRVTVDELLGEGRMLLRPIPGTIVGAGLGGGWIDYHSDLLDRRYGIGDAMQVGWVRSTAVQMVSRQWGLMAQGLVGLGSDGHAPWKDGFQYQASVGPVYISGDGLLCMVGVYTSSRIGLNPTIIPILSLDWRISERWRVRIFEPVDNLSRVTWSPDPRWQVGLRIDARSLEYALDHTSSWGQAAVLHDTRVMVAAEAAWLPFADDRFQLRPFAGFVAGRTLTVRDQWGNELFDDRVRPAPDLGLTLRSEF